MFRIGCTERALPIASHKSMTKMDVPSDFRFTSAIGVVRAKNHQVEILHAQYPDFLPIDCVPVTSPLGCCPNLRG
ncbi:hypothetical protein R69776_01586 [Paraburkholderia nemoris]|uniref:Uncharacterized protein n=1 Tax=Paraburkholderia nemoris TaxID=2793076 RepID=A0ABM8QXW9_9BURK|nr:hypothetical protein R69776_01586 [Paraburkholderia nemoris]CAE6750830.1 hypothetical protein R75777_02983 [Paraburkholderia nemoris]